MNAEDRYDSLIQHYAERYGCEWRLVKAQLMAESSMNPEAKSPVGAVGLGQFMPQTWREWGRVGDRTNPEHSIRATCRYMIWLYEKFEEIPDEEERWKFALAAYNAGRSNINQMLGLARKADGLPASHAEWEAAGRPGGPWQTWEIASRALSIVTGRHAEETLGYVNRVMGGIRRREALA